MNSSHYYLPHIKNPDYIDRMLEHDQRVGMVPVLHRHSVGDPCPSRWQMDPKWGAVTCANIYDDDWPTEPS